MTAEQAKGALYSSIVVGTDGSETASKAVTRAAELAAASSATLSIVSAFRPVPPERLRNERAGAPEDLAYVVNSREDVDHLLSVAKKLAESLGASSVRTEAVDSDPSEALIDVAERAQCRSDRRGQQRDDRSQALHTRKRPEPRRPPHSLRRPDREDRSGARLVQRAPVAGIVRK